MKQFTISEELANALLQYLGKNPYVDVARLIQGLMMLQEIKPNPEPKMEDQKDG